MAEAFQACRAASQSISAASNGGRGSQEAADACSSRRRAIRRRHSAVDEGRGGRVVARHMEVHNTSDSTVEFLHGQEMAYFDARSKGLVQINNLKHFPIDQYLHDRMTPATLSPSPLAYEKPIHPAEMPCITTRTELPIDDTNKSTPDDKYPWLDPDDVRRNMTDKEILQMKLNLKDSILNEKEKEEFLMKVEQFTDVFSLRDEIGTCPFIEVHLKLKDETPFFVRP